MRRVLIAGLLVLVTLLAPVAASASDVPGPRTLDDIAELLRADPILVEPPLGTGDTAGVHDVLTDLAAELDVPVFVVLASTPAELRTTEQPAEQAAALLTTSLGDGLYVVQFTDGISWTGGFGTAAGIDVSPGLRAYTRSRKLGPYEYNVPTAALEAELVLRSAARPGVELSDDEVREIIDSPRAFVPSDATDRVDREAQRWVYTLAAATAVLVAGIILSVVVTANSAGSARSPSSNRRRPDKSAPVITSADPQTLARVHRTFDALHADQLGSPHAVAAAEALTAADLVVRTGDELDVIGAWVLALQAERELQRLGRSTRVAYRPCVVNPEHGEASATVRLAGSSIDAPACTACSRDTGEFLMASTWRGDRPYLDTSTVWARTGFGALVDDLARQVIDDRDAS